MKRNHVHLYRGDYRPRRRRYGKRIRRWIVSGVPIVALLSMIGAAFVLLLYAMLVPGG